MLSARALAAVVALLSLFGGASAAFAQAGAQTALLAAAKANDAGRAFTAIDEGADVKAVAPDGTTALHYAVYHDNLALIERLVAKGADANAANQFGSTPMVEAATVGNAAVIEKLLDAGASVESPGADGQTALMVLARGGHIDAAKLLLARGANPNARELWRQQTALMWAAAQNQPEMVRLLIEHGAEVDARSVENKWERQVTGEPRRMYRPMGGLTSLLYAAREGCLECARALVDAGADIDLPDPKNVTALFLAVDNLHFDLAKYLIEKGANVNKWDWWGRTPLYSAVDLNTLPHGGRSDRLSIDQTTSLEIIELLLAKGANPNAQLKLGVVPYRHIGDDRGCDTMLTIGTTPLLRAAKTFDTAAMKLLIAHKARLDLPNVTGIAPVMAAAGYGSVECDPRGYGPGIPHYVTPDVEQKSIEALRVLLDAGADVNQRTLADRGPANPRGQTALFGAAFWGWNDVVKFLVERGATIDLADVRGLTAVDAALGKAGGHGRGQAIEVYQDTADLVVELCKQQSGCDLAKPKRPPST
jgi:ankyrin repeat protein